MFMFPFLGGSVNSYINLIKYLPKDYEIIVANPPGHSTSKLLLVDDIEDLLNIYYDEIIDMLHQDTVFFGHSMGGTIAYFLIQKIYEQKGIIPQRLIISACAAPDYMKGFRYSQLSDYDLIKKLSEFDGIPEEVMQSDEMIEFFSPIFRSDYKVLESAAVKDYSQLKIPAYLIWNRKDSMTPQAAFQEWYKYIGECITVLTVDELAGHMFIESRSKLLSEMIIGIMNGSLDGEED